MQNGTWATVAVCGLLGGCADLAFLLRPSPPVTLSAGETVVEGATDLQEGTVRTRSTRKMVPPPKPVLAEKQPSQTTPSQTTVDAPTTGATGSTSITLITPDEVITPAQREAQRAEAQRAQEELITQRERAIKRALSGICTGC
jgi:hypothetical protein